MLNPEEREALVVKTHDTLVEALEKIDANRKGFVIVEDDDGVVVGSLTDGDIRRALIGGASLDDMASDAMNTAFTSLSADQEVDDAIDIFKRGSIVFIPVLAPDGSLANVLLKKQLYSLLLQCRNLSLSDDFSEIEENLVDFEVFNRPWGIYKTTILQDAFQAKVIQVKPGAQLSLQYHNRREEFWTVASGEGEAQVGESRFPLHAGSNVVIPRGCIHRLRNTSATEWLVVSEVQVGDYFGEDDIVRIEDDYGRAEGGAGGYERG